MSRRSRGTFVPLLVTMACAGAPSARPRGPAPTSDPSPAPADAAPGPARASEVARLSSLGVHHDDFARPDLYSWTTPAQIEALRASRVLLVATEDTGGRASPFHGSLQSVATSAEGALRTIATALQHDPRLRRHRYAWPNPYATVLGLGPRRYGSELIRIELHPDSFVGRLAPHRDDPLMFVDMHGRAVPPEEVAASPHRIAAIYHVRDGPEDEVPYREYVVCSAQMVQRWSIATDAIRARVTADRRMLEALSAGEFAHLPDLAVEEPAQPSWRQRGAPHTPLAAWQATLAFDNERYRPSVGHLRRAAKALGEYVGAGEPFEQTIADPGAFPPPPE